MQVKTKLPPQLIGLIAGALIFEAVFWLTIHNLSAGAQSEAREAARSIAVSTKIESVSRLAKEILTSCADPLQTPDQRICPFNKSKLESDFGELKNLVGNSSAKLAIVVEAEKNAFEHLKETEALRQTTSTQPSAKTEIDPLWVKIQKHEIAIISEELKELGVQEKNNAEKLTESNIQKRHDINNIEIMCLCFKAFILLLAICLLAKKLSDRLNWIAALSVLQLVAFAALLNSLQGQSERDMQRNVRALKTVSAIKEVSSYFADIETIIVQNALARPRTAQETAVQGTRYVPLFPDMELDIIARLIDKRHLIAFHYESLKQLLKEDANQLSVINSSKKTADNTFSIIESMYSRLDKQIRAARVDDIDHSQERRSIWRQVQTDVKSILSADLLSLLALETEQTVRSPKQQEWLKQQINSVLLIECLIIFCCLSVIAFTIRSVTKRVNIMNDNAIRLASGMQLHAPVKGNDEVSELDRTFHSMAEALDEANRKQGAILENASDVICSIGSAGHFTAVNAASLSVFGYLPNEMFGKLFVDFVFKDDIESVVAAIDRLKKGGSSETIEARMVRKDGALIDTLWSATWSASDKAVFCVMHDITERKEAERMKQEVVAMITHDLRTPLSTIRNFHEMLSSGLLGDVTEKADKMLKIAERNSGRMLNLINDLLDVEKIKAGMMELSKEEVSAEKVLEQAVQSICGLAAESEITLVCQCRAEETRIHIDEDKISRVIINLISNAIKFSPKQASIICTAEVENGAVRFKVEDQGRGIPPDKLASIFDRFQQVSAADHSKAGGSGLGLAICKAIVGLHGGEIWVESVEGKGSTFIFTIPRLRG